MQLAAASIGCRGDSHTRAPERPVETAIARDLTARFGMPVEAHCELPIPACHATLADGSVIPVRLTSDGSGFDWHLDGVIDTQPIARYVDAMLAENHVAKTADCGARVRRIDAGQRLTCELSGGGRAFVDIGAGGALSVELELDPAAAAARGEAVSPAREHELEQKSRALDHGSDTDEP